MMIDFKRHDNFYVISGGPGVGKTSLLNELKSRNMVVIPEIARELIKEQQRVDGEALPWRNRELYKKMMFERSLESFEENGRKLKTDIPVFFDRSFLDTLCYATLIASEVDERMKTYAAKWRYNKNIFILPPWKSIYKTDSERKQTWKDAVVTYEKMTETYQNYGYQIIEIPKTSVHERANFVFDFIKQASGTWKHEVFKEKS